MSEQNVKIDFPCNNCVHKNVCSVRKNFEETKVNTTHPFIIVELKCTEYISLSRFENNTRAIQ